MTTINNLWELRKQTDKYVLCNNQMFVLVDGEYVRKLYFSVQEVAQVLNKEENQVHRICQRMGIQAPANRRKKLRITLKQLRQMAQTT